jgi:hypothetical protein
MQIRYGLYLLLAITGVLAIVFAALRAWGALGLVPVVLAALSLWLLHVMPHFEGDFEQWVMLVAGILFALGAVLFLGSLVINSA